MAAYASSAVFNGNGFMTVALIDLNGNWRRSARASSDVAVFVDPDTFSEAFSWIKKAHCVNSGTFEQVVYAQCGRGYWAPDPGDGCV